MPQTLIYIDTQSMWVWFYTTSASKQPAGKVFSGLIRQKSVAYGLNYKRTQLSDMGAAEVKGTYPAFEYALYTKGPTLGSVTINAADKKVMLRYVVPQAEIRAELERRGRRLAAKLLSALLPPGVAEKVMTSI